MKIFLICFVVFAGRDCLAADVKLVESGKAACTIVVAGNASRPERFGARELAAYLNKKQGGDAEPVVLDIDASDFAGFALDAPASLRARSFLVYMTDWIEFKDFSIHAVL